MSNFLTTRQAADEITSSPLIEGEVTEWRIRRLFEDGILREPHKFGGKRMISRRRLPQIIHALRARRWLPDQEIATDGTKAQ